MKNNIVLEDAEIKNRLEIRSKNDRATQAVKGLLEHQNAEKTALETINHYIRFADKDETKRRSDWQANERWEWSIGKNHGALRLTIQPEPYPFERTLNWSHHRVAPILKVASILDTLNGTTIISTVIHEAKLTEKHEKLIEQQYLGMEDLIT